MSQTRLRSIKKGRVDDVALAEMKNPRMAQRHAGVFVVLPV